MIPALSMVSCQEYNKSNSPKKVTKSATLPCVHPQHVFSFQSFFLSLRSGLYYHLAIIKQKLLNYFYYLYIFWGRSTHPLPHPTGGMFRYTAAKYKKVLLPSLHSSYSSSKWKSSDDFPLSFQFFLSCFGSGW